MAEYTINKIEYDGDVYNLEDANVANMAISSTYDSSTHTVTLTVGALGDADSTEY